MSAARKALEAARLLLDRLKHFSDAPSDTASDQRWHFDVLPAMRDLDAALAAPQEAGGVRVKALEWPDWIRQGQRVQSTGGLLTYTIAHYGGSQPDSGVVYRWAASGGPWSEAFFAYEHAIVAAQADYEARILSALEPGGVRAEPVAPYYCSDCESHVWELRDGRCGCGSGRVVTAPVSAPSPSVVEALQFYRDQWQTNSEGDIGGEAHLIRSWQEPTELLWQDAGRKAHEALAALAAQTAPGWRERIATLTFEDAGEPVKWKDIRNAFLKTADGFVMDELGRWVLPASPSTTETQGG